VLLLETGQLVDKAVVIRIGYLGACGIVVIPLGMVPDCLA
jgi:hypothetical protein